MLPAGLSAGTRRLAAGPVLAVQARALMAPLAGMGGVRANHSNSGPPAEEESKEPFPVKMPEDATEAQVAKMREIQKKMSKRFVEGGRYALGNFLPKNVQVSAEGSLPRPVPLPIRNNIKVRRTGKSDWNNYLTPQLQGDGTSRVPRENATRGRVNRSRINTKPLTIPIKPAAHAAAQTEAPHNVVELVKRYPRHPLLKFFDLIPVSEADHSIKYRGLITKENDERHKDTYGNILVPVTLHDGMLGRDPSYRAWESSELRLKSSFELHQLWYLCVFERNKLSTAWAEVRRTELGEALSMAQQNISYRLYKLRWTQIRIKAVLLERSEALQDARAIEKARRLQAEREARLLAEEEEGDEARSSLGYRQSHQPDEPPAGAYETPSEQAGAGQPQP